MIIDTIALRNFGVYQGHQEAVLTPEKGRPVTLCGGMNGGGKTTFLDAIQLGLYGSKARTSNRGRRAYKTYLANCIHRKANREEGASITLRFRIHTRGALTRFEVCRHWYYGAKDIEENLIVKVDGEPDAFATEHWGEIMEGYLPTKIAHLFFFDGEQIKDLAEGEHTAEILGTAIQSLLGLDLVDQLQTDLKVFQKKKREEGISDDERKQFDDLQCQADRLLKEEGDIRDRRGRLVNALGRATQNLEKKREAYRRQGGELFENREVLQQELRALSDERTQVEAQLRELASGPLMFCLLSEDLLGIADLIQCERVIVQARAMVDLLEERDRDMIEALGSSDVPAKAMKKIATLFKEDVERRRAVAGETLRLNAGDHLVAEIRHLVRDRLPHCIEDASSLIEKRRELTEARDKQEAVLARIPMEESLEEVSRAVEEAQAEHDGIANEMKEIDRLLIEKQGQRKLVEGQIDKLGHSTVEARYAEEDRLLALQQSERVADTLNTFRSNIASQHIARLEQLMLDCFVRLLRKKGLVSALKIDPRSYEVNLFDCDGGILDFDRLSAGERQLLATSLLWGLARASGRPVPTVIDTPLGRLDSSHRSNLVERYFPVASHQVLLLSTDEEIVGRYHETLKPYLARTYLLDHDKNRGITHIQDGYFHDSTD